MSRIRQRERTLKAQRERKGKKGKEREGKGKKGEGRGTKGKREIKGVGVLGEIYWGKVRKYTLRLSS